MIGIGRLVLSILSKRRKRIRKMMELDNEGDKARWIEEAIGKLLSENLYIIPAN